MHDFARRFGRRKMMTAGFALALLLVVVAGIQPHLSEGTLRVALSDLFLWLVVAFPTVAAGLQARDWLREVGYSKGQRTLLWLFLGAVYIIGFVFVSHFFSAEEDIRVYDSTVYWIKVIGDRQIASESIPAYLLHLRTMFAQEYNNLAALPLIPLTRLLGVGFAGYCLSILFVYYLPACLFLTIFILRLAKLARGKIPGAAVFMACFCLCALCVSFFWPVMNGYLDVCGVLVFALLLNAAFHWDCTEFSAGKNLALAALTLVLALSRRWYAFNIVGFYLAFAVVALPGLLATPGKTGKRLGTIFLNMAMIAGVCSVCFLVINPSLFSLFLSSRYATAYSGMKTMSMPQNLWEIAANMGVLWMAAAFVGMRLLLKSDEARPTCVRLLITAAVSFVMFCSIQDMGYHQSYLVIPTLLVFAGTFYAVAVEFSLESKKAPIAAALLAAALVNFAFGYAPRLQAAAAKTQPFTTAMRRYPRINRDYAAIRQVVDDLSEKTRGGTHYVYVVGDGSALSPEILKRSHLPDRIDAAPYVLVNNILDLRDGFPSQLFLADYVLLREPFLTEFHNPQQVSVEVNDMLLHDPETAAFYQREAAYPTSDGVIVLLRKAAPMTTKYVDNLKERLRRHYPDTPFVYEPNYFIALCTIDADTGYSYNMWDDNAITLPKQAGRPAAIRLDGIEGQSTLSFALSSWEQGLKLRVANQNGEIFRQPVARTLRAPYRIDVAGSEFLTITLTEAASESPIAGGVILYHPRLGDSLLSTDTTNF